MILIPQVQVYPITISLVVLSPPLVRLLALLVAVLHGICYGMNNGFELYDFYYLTQHLNPYSLS